LLLNDRVSSWQWRLRKGGARRPRSSASIGARHLSARPRSGGGQITSLPWATRPAWRGNHRLGARPPP
jgi:hypothetical protein